MPDAVIDTTIKALQAQLATLEPVASVELEKHEDAVMALWGTDETHEDDPQQAIRAALAMQTTLATFRKEQNLQIAMRIGIDTGLVLLGTIGTTKEFTAIALKRELARRQDDFCLVRLHMALLRECAPLDFNDNIGDLFGWVNKL